MLLLLPKYHIPAAPRPALRAALPNRMSSDTAKGKIAVGNRIQIFMRDEKRRAAHPIRWTNRLAIRLYVCLFSRSLYRNAIACPRQPPG